MGQDLEVRIHGSAQLPALIYLPGAHGDWTLIARFRESLAGKVRFVEFAYPRTTTWTIADHASAIVNSLESSGIHGGWVLGESFGSQIAWHLLTQPERFRAHGVILAGGFPRHPIPLEVRLAILAGKHMPNKFQDVFSIYAKIKRRFAPATAANLEEFFQRRAISGDLQAINHRVALLLQSDLRQIARTTATPIYMLSGLFDPVVPWPLVHHWLCRNCPSYSGRKIILHGDHNVLGTAPQRSAQQVLKWMRITS